MQAEQQALGYIEDILLEWMNSRNAKDVPN